MSITKQLVSRLAKREFSKATPLALAVAAALAASSPAQAQLFYKVSDIGFANLDVCRPAEIPVHEALLKVNKGVVGQFNTEIEADGISTDGTDVVILEGNAQVVQGRRGVFADEIRYNNKTYIADAKGNVQFFTEVGDRILAEELSIEADTFIGTAKNVNLTLANRNLSENLDTRTHSRFRENYTPFSPFSSEPSDFLGLEERDFFESNKSYERARARVETMEIDSVDFQRLYNTVFTTCPQGNDDVQIIADELELDHASGIGTARNMTLRFKDIPIFYFPWASFPINNQRKTGFLFPTVGYESDSGVIVDVPYYVNIAPNLDATVTPRYLQNRGFQLFGEARYLGKQGQGIVHGEVLPSDDIFGDDRSAFSVEFNQLFGEEQRLQLVLDYNAISDSEYLSDFETDVNVTGASFVPQDIDLTYRGDYFTLGAKVQDFDIVNDRLNENNLPYEIKPELSFKLEPVELGVVEFDLDASRTEFEHRSDALVSGSRTRVKPSVALNFEEIYGFFKPKAAVQGIQYDLENTTGDTSPSVEVPIFSIDSGLFFDRYFQNAFGDYYQQTIEPRVFYVNIPEENQNDLPDFDTGLSSFSSYSHFFRENRFFGGDRVGDTHQLSLGVTSRLINEDTGIEDFSFSIGQIFFFEDRTVSLPVTAPSVTVDGVTTPGETTFPVDTDTLSSTIAELTAKPNEDWTLTGFTRFNTEESELEGLRFSAEYSHSERRKFGVSYSRETDTLNNTDGGRNDELEQATVRFTTPLAPEWQLNGGVNYSFDDSEVRSSELNLLYDGCCWALALGATRTLDGRGEFKNAVVLSLQLDNFGAVRARN